jgi:hypothetical protein
MWKVRNCDTATLNCKVSSKKSQNDAYKNCDLNLVGMLPFFLNEGNSFAFGDDLSGENNPNFIFKVLPLIPLWSFLL